MKKFLTAIVLCMTMVMFASCTLPFIQVPSASVSEDDDSSGKKDKKKDKDKDKDKDKTSASDSISPDTGDGIVDLTQDQCDYFTEFLRSDFNYGFLQSSYDDVRDVNLDWVLYDFGSGGLTDEQYDHALEVAGIDWVDVSVSMATRAEIDDLLLKKTGYKLDEFRKSIDGAYYDYDNKTYYRFKGDTNFIPYLVQDGYVLNGTGYVLHVVEDTSFWGGAMSDRGFVPTRLEVWLEKVGDEYHFSSCRQLIEENYIEDVHYSFIMPEYGECGFYAYYPVDEQSDVTFKIVNDGEVINTLGYYTKDNNYVVSPFVEVADIGFKDFTDDGYEDIIAVCKYESGAISYKVYVNAGYSGVMFENTDLEKALLDLTDRQLSYYEAYAFALDQYTGQESSDWKKAYYDFLSQTAIGEDHPEFTLIKLGDNPAPVLVCVGDCEATGVTLAAWCDGNIETQDLYRLYFEYQENTGLILNCEGHMGYYYDTVYELKNGKFNLKSFGTYEEDQTKDPDPDLGYPYIYKWENKEVSEETYQKKLNENFDTSKGCMTYEWDRLLTLEEMQRMLDDYYTKAY